MRQAIVGCLLAVVSIVMASPAVAADPRIKLDVLVIGAHSDDETIITPLLARMTFDQKKRVGVAFIGSGSGGPNNVGRERGRALGILRREESVRGLATLGITHVWFLGDHVDGGSSNMLTALASVGHGAMLEKIVRVVRATQPEVIISWMPVPVIGENHGEHQASGAIAAEAFELAADETAFPAQLTSFGSGGEGLRPWAVKKMYYATDAFAPEIIDGTGPSYSTLDVSPSQKRSYLSLAAGGLAEYPTQFTNELEELFGVTLQEVTRAIGTPDEQKTLVKLTQGSSPFWFEPTRLVRARSRVGGAVAEDVFDGLDRPLANAAPGAISQPAFEIGGPWAYSRQLRERYRLEGLAAIPAQIAVARDNRKVALPLRFSNASNAPVTVRVVLESPAAGWSEAKRAETIVVAPHDVIEVTSRLTAAADAAPRWTATYRAEVDGKVVGRAPIVIALTDWTMPQ